VIYYRVNEGSFKFEERENRKVFELQKTQCALPAATREGGIKGQKQFLQNRFYSLKIPLINKST
jgi:hypothetical protein